MENDYKAAQTWLTTRQLEEIGSVPMTREQKVAFSEISTDVDAMRQFCYDVWRARMEDAELRERELEQIAEEEREDRWKELGLTLPDWCYDEQGDWSVLFRLLIGATIGLLLFIPALWFGMESVLGVLGAIGIFYWLFRLFGWLLLPIIGSLFGFGVSAHRFWRGWQFGRRHS